MYDVRDSSTETCNTFGTIGVTILFENLFILKPNAHTQTVILIQNLPSNWREFDTRRRRFVIISTIEPIRQPVPCSDFTHFLPEGN